MFSELENSAPAGVRDEILELISQLYGVERVANGHREMLARRRDERSRPLVAQIRTLLFAQKAQALPRSAL